MALEKETENIMSNTRIGIPKSISIPVITAETNRNIDTQDGIPPIQSDDSELYDKRLRKR